MKTVEPLATRDMIIKKPHYHSKSSDRQKASSARRLFDPLGNINGITEERGVDYVAQSLYPEFPNAVAFHYALPTTGPRYEPESDINVARHESCHTIPSMPEPLPVLARRCADGRELVSKLLPYSPEERGIIEEATRGQADNEEWFRMKQGRISASIVHRVLTCSSEQAAARLTQDVVTPKNDKLGIPAIVYGRLTEPIARKAYDLLCRDSHSNLRVTECGLFVDVDRAFLCASPDGLVTCDCCGEGLLEIKCPKTCEDTDPKESGLSYLVDSNGKLELKRNHTHFSQVQMQMGVVGRQWCDFLVYSRAGYFLQRIPFDATFWQSVQCKCDQFFGEHLSNALTETL